jgi:glycosyltransferase involved in cell wall biosynthesis
MAAGKAIVAPRYVPLEDVIDDGVQGLLFPPRDCEALVRSVLRLVDGPELRRSLGRAAAERACSSLSWEHNARRVLEACQRARSRTHLG